jgi:poly(A) polymerase
VIRLTDAWLTAPQARAVCGLLTAAGHQALFVGGCVRNALLGAPVADIDIATDAPPTRVMALAAAAGTRAVPTGIEHGTVTLVAGGEPFEVTTFRRDVETFGRNATVAFSTDIAEDAARRQYTLRPTGHRHLIKIEPQKRLSINWMALRYRPLLCLPMMPK